MISREKEIDDISQNSIVFLIITFRVVMTSQVSQKFGASQHLTLQPIACSQIGLML